MEVGEIELTVGTIAGAVTVTDWEPDEQSALPVCDDERHTRT